MSRKKNIIIVTILAVFAINLFFGFPRLSHYSSVDEPYWTYNRTPDFWRAIAQRKWKNTDINDKPGITVAAISGIGLLRVDPMQYASLRQEPKTLETAKAIMRTNFVLRLPIYLTTLLFLLLFFIFIKKLFNTTIALLSLIFIGLSPVILGISLIINPDSLLWGFLPLAVLAYLVYQKESRTEKTKISSLDLKNDRPGKVLAKIFKKKKYLIFAGTFLGLSILTKYVANILYVYILGLLFLEYIYNFQSEKVLPYLKKALGDYLILIVVSCAVFYLLYPACWHDSKTLLNGTFLSPAFKSTWPVFVGFLGLILADLIFLQSWIASKVLNFLSRYKNLLKKLIAIILFLGTAFVLINTYSGMKFVDFQSTLASPKGGSGFDAVRFFSEIATNLYALLFSLSPLVFFGFLWALFANSFKKIEAASQESLVVLYFSLFIILYYVASETNHVVATTRYQISVFPLASIIAAIGLAQVLTWLQKKNLKEWTLLTGTLVLAIVLSVFSLLSIKPFFFNYASALLPQKYLVNFKDMGDGSFEAAQYLNSLPNAQNLIVWSDKGAVCETFVGKCNVGFSKKDTKDVPFDYFVASTGRKSRSLKLESAGYFDRNIEFRKLYSDDAGTYKIIIGGRAVDFVKIYKTSTLLEK